MERILRISKRAIEYEPTTPTVRPSTRPKPTEMSRKKKKKKEKSKVREKKKNESIYCTLGKVRHDREEDAVIDDRLDDKVHVIRNVGVGRDKVVERGNQPITGAWISSEVTTWRIDQSSYIGSDVGYSGAGLLLESGKKSYNSRNLSGRLKKKHQEKPIINLPPIDEMCFSLTLPRQQCRSRRSRVQRRNDWCEPWDLPAHPE